ncbi:ABC transporter ATP-binding protein [Arsenicitalea aurantiaca]|uniref:ABC transporter ATP-binding protein n=1 Tax=Arsenicitalea aurantiaca TaxID=1783274 RepID=A0A433XEG5_9HYPH|nr:ATP-binding cassette domain-containing protein [Arsenicitalea aurantiaca]RUT32472.1 ABC transporter ATP-binding protein [Arsenicitalea aurantiaca]
MSGHPIVSLKGVAKTFGKRLLVQNRSFALSDIDITVGRGEVVGILGESGSGKSTVANIVTRLTGFDAGTYLFDGADVSAFDKKEGFRFKSRVQIVFQDPYGSLNPRATVAASIMEGLVLHRPEMDKATRRARVAQLLDEVGLPADCGDRYPHEFSGGQRQRIAIARALAVEPELLVLDEPLSSLDVSIQAQVLELFVKLIGERDLTIIFISHDVNVVRLICDRVYVMHQGRIVEEGSAEDVLTHPRNAYTERLLAAVY